MTEIRVDGVDELLPAPADGRAKLREILPSPGDGGRAVTEKRRALRVQERGRLR